ncbi:G5 domain-containing protein [Kribbella sancticallisti]|uniref:G5 domain-containing protein n=1 Tax=Kribbella sancticallisti TaxID=460087 RepID=UPI003CD05EB4
METRRIAFRKVTAQDPEMDKGDKVVTTRGVAGTRRLTYELTLTDGVQTGKRLVRQVVVKQPVTQILLVPTSTASTPTRTARAARTSRGTGRSGFGRGSGGWGSRGGCRWRCG